MEFINYPNYGKSVCLSNNEIEIIITIEKGPRIIRCGFIDEINLFTDKLTDGGIDVPEGYWKNYGGHRLWIAPEELPRTYEIDRETRVEEIENGIKVISSTDPNTRMRKEMHITLDPKNNQVEVDHLIFNENCWDVECSVWPVSVMTTGGIAILSLPEFRPHDGNLAPCHNLASWRYTKMADPRWTWGNEYILLRQDDQYEEPQKIGMFSLNGEFGYAVEGFFFKKSFEVSNNQVHPDMQTNMEVFTQPGMLELETLSPMTKIAPSKNASLKETWNLYKDIPQPNSEQEVKDNFDKFFNRK